MAAKAELARKLQSNTNPKVSYAGSVANSSWPAPSVAGGNEVRSCMSVDSRYIPCYPRSLVLPRLDEMTQSGRAINCASTSRTSEATRFRDAGVARSARAAPRRTRWMEPMMMAPTTARFTWCIAYVKFTLVAGDAFGMSIRKVEASKSGEVRESVGVLECGAGRRMLNTD